MSYSLFGIANLQCQAGWSLRQPRASYPSIMPHDPRYGHSIRWSLPSTNRVDASSCTLSFQCQGSNLNFHSNWGVDLKLMPHGSTSEIRNALFLHFSTHYLRINFSFISYISKIYCEWSHHWVWLHPASLKLFSKQTRCHNVWNMRPGHLWF
jgi:hypothetical protein